MKVQTATLQGSGRSNQDAIVVTRHAAAVLDGASSWLPQPAGRDGGWYARELGACLQRSLDSSTPVPVLLAEAIASVRDRFNLVPGKSPESTVTIARWDDSTVDIYVLCDSPAVLIHRKGDATVVRDDRLGEVGKSERERYRRHLTSGCGYDPELDHLVAQLQLAERKARNRPGGYWVAEAVPEAALHGHTHSVPICALQAVLLLTDGASASVDQYGEPSSWSAAFDRIRAGGANRFLASIHDLEASDPNGQRLPRAKRHDDKTLLLITP